MLKSMTILTLVLTLILSSAARAEDIVDAHIKAIGGAEAIAKIKTVKRTGTLSGESSFGPLRGTVEEIADLAKQQGYTSMQMAGYSRKTGWSGNSGWVSDTQAGTTEMPAGEVQNANSVAGPSALASIHAQGGAEALKAAGAKKFNGKECTVVSTIGDPTEFYVNNETKMLEGLSVPGVIEITYDNYKTVSGVQFAGKSTMKVIVQDLTVTYEYNTIEVNRKIDATKFENHKNSVSKQVT